MENIHLLNNDLLFNMVFMNSALSFGGSLLDLLNTVLKLVTENKKNKADEEEKFRQIILFVRSLKYYQYENINNIVLFNTLNKIGDYLKTYYDDKLSDIFVISLKDVYWALNYNSEIHDYTIEANLKPIIAQLRRRKFKVN